MVGQVRVEGANARDFEKDVDHGADHRGADDGAFGIARLAAELDRPLETQVGEDDSARGERR